MKFRTSIILLGCCLYCIQSIQAQCNVNIDPCPDPIVNLQCDSDLAAFPAASTEAEFEMLAAGIGTPVITTSGSGCGAIAVSSMDEMNAGDGSNGIPLIITRTYEITSGTGSGTCIQTFNIEDTEPPVFLDCPPSMELEMMEGACEMPVSWIEPTMALDHCTGLRPIIQISGSGSGSLFPIGVFPIVYTADDGHGNPGTCSFDINIVPQCNVINLSLNEECFGDFIPEMVVGQELFDCLGNFSLTVLDENGDPRSNRFTLEEDFGESFSFIVENPGIGYVCENIVTIEDYIDPILDCPPDVTVNCMELANFSGYPMPDFVGFSCDIELADINKIKDHVDMTVCDPNAVGVIRQAYVARDAAGNFSNTCDYNITLGRLDILTEIEMPSNYIGANAFNCTDDLTLADTGVPKTGSGVLMNGVQIDLFPTPGNPVPPNLCNIRVEYEDLFVSRKNCIEKIWRKWTIYEWHCTGEVVRPPYIQMIEKIDQDGPDITCPDPWTVNTDSWVCEGIVDIPDIMAVDECSDIQKVQIVYPGGVLINPVDTSVVLPPGNHLFEWSVFDECDKKSECSVIVSVADQNPPLMFCSGPMEVDLGILQSISVPAETFDLGSMDGCGMDYLQVSRMTDHCGGPSVPVYGNEVNFCCADVGNDEVMVLLRGYDIYNNFRDCMIPVTVTTSGVCPPVPPFSSQTDIKGQVYREDLQMIPDAKVIMETEGNPYSMTSEDGQYQISGMNSSESPMIHVEKIDDPLNGISTLDLVHIQRYILGLEDFATEYQKIAADANSDFRVSAIDILELRKLILGKTDHLQSDITWKFLWSDYSFNTNRRALIEAYPQGVRIDELNGRTQVDFIGVKIGDVNRDAIMRTATDVRSKATYPLLVTTRKEGTYVKMDFIASRDEIINGLQISTEYKGLDFDRLISGRLDLSDEHYYNSTTDVINVSWNYNNGIFIRKNQVLFSMKFIESESELNLMPVLLKLNKTRIKSEVYLGDQFETQEIELIQQGNPDAGNEFEVYANKPNPWFDQTILGCYLPKPSKLGLNIFDASGKAVYSDEFFLQAGNHQLSLTRKEIAGPGIYICQIIYKDRVEIFKMVVVN